MNLMEMVQKKLNETGTKSLTQDERAELIEAIRRKEAWEVFVEYHHGALWAREDATRKQEENVYLPPEAVEYMQGEIKRRAGREALLKIMEQQEQERVEREYAKGIGSATASQAAQRGDKPDAGRDAADNRSEAGEGKEGTESGGEVRPGTSETAAVEPDTAAWASARGIRMAGELQTSGRRHESQPASDAPVETQDGPIDGTAYGVGGKD